MGDLRASAGQCGSRGPIVATSPTSRSTRAPTSIPARWPTRCASTRPIGRVPTTSPRRGCSTLSIYTQQVCQCASGNRPSYCAGNERPRRSPENRQPSEHLRPKVGGQVPRENIVRTNVRVRGRTRNDTATHSVAVDLHEQYGASMRVTIQFAFTSTFNPRVLGSIPRRPTAN